MSASCASDGWAHQWALLGRLVPQGRVRAIRVDPAITVSTVEPLDGALLAKVLATPPALGEGVGDRGQEGPPVCPARPVTAALRSSRTGHQAAYQEATLQVVPLVPRDGTTEPLGLATTLPVATPADVLDVGRVSPGRWAIESGAETMTAWGLGRFIVRSWQAMDRRRWTVAVAFALLVVAARHGPPAIFREQAIRLLKRLAVLGRRLTVGRLAEAIGVASVRPRRAWATVWLT